MGVARSSYYATPTATDANAALVAEMRAITDAWECYGYRRVGAELRHRGCIVNAKKVRRLMRLHDLNPRRRRRYTKTTDSNHDGPIYPLIARGFEVHGPDQLWVGDITFVAIAAGFVYVAVILDAWSRRVVGYAIGRRIDARLAVAAFERAIHCPAGDAPHRREGPCAARFRGASSIRIAARNTRPLSTGHSSSGMASSVR